MATPDSDFAAAATRHFDDAALLLKSQRFANADHLAGFAAECALKALLIAFLGGALNARGRPTHPSQSSGSFGHLPGLWSDLGAVAQGRQATSLAALLSGSNMFSSWDVSERYAHGGHITSMRAQHHLQQAEKILRIYQQAEIDGSLQ